MNTDQYFDFDFRDDGIPAEMVWVDMETTGLQPPEGRRHEKVLEVGCIVTDLNGNERATFEHLVMAEDWEHMLSTAVPYVQSMHTKNGLWKSLSNWSDNDQYTLSDMEPETVDLRLRDFLNAAAGSAEEMPLAGSTINFDRYFLGAYFHESYRWFHYRNIDVSSVKGLCQRLNPELYKTLPRRPGQDKEHRCLSDIRNSIAEYQFYKNNFLILP